MTNKELSGSHAIMDEENQEDTFKNANGRKRPRTSEDFYLFCTYILEYENYDAQKNEEIRNSTNLSPPLDSSGSSVNSESNSEATNSGQDDKPSGDETDEGNDSHDLVTCYCGKPFAGRPMIECSLCLTWIHLSCARIKKNNIPDVFHCAICKANKKQRAVSPSNPPDKSKRHKKPS
ncbi:PHD finger protein 23A [Agrilus planipennis]|uniref:PHD finger protein 23A n=1 Tax=Agrilus planipennis TaxID=224129 RepID=A0A1W4WNM6_AGRPL|nr:PHD finger protein 23A [Agrilus planipennis]